MEPRIFDDPGTLIIKHCHASRFAAEHIYALLAVQRHHHLEIPEGVIDLSDEEIGEFVHRYSSEVVPEIYRSGRWKDLPRPERSIGGSGQRTT